MSTRRTFIKSGIAATGATTLAAFPSLLTGQPPGMLRRRDAGPGTSFLNNPEIKALAQRSIDAARSAGAHFADVRITNTRTLEIKGGKPSPGETITVGVRALVDGYWGFAAGPVWTDNELARLGKEAAAQAKANTLGQVRRVALAEIPRVEDRQWIMPIIIDPFEISPAEIVDFFGGLDVYMSRTPKCQPGQLEAAFVRQDKVYASTEGSLYAQRTYRSRGTVQIKLVIDKTPYMGAVDLLSPAGMGWELFRDQPIREAIDQEIERMRKDHRMPWKPVDVGKYVTVFDSPSVGGLMSQTIGAATELDRAMGYEANATGTSYVTDPLEMCGTLMVGTPSLAIAGNRSAPGSVGTVQWDDEGVVPDEVPIVTQGRLTDFATSRESAGWMKEVSARMHIPSRSHGCAYAPEGEDAPLVHTPNLVMASAANTDTLETFVTGLSRGVLFTGFVAYMDFQQLNGLGQGMCYEIKDGKRVAKLAHAGILFRTPELWKSVSAIGGQTSVRRFGFGASKGEPAQQSFHSVTSVPMVAREMTVVDVMRKA